MNGARENSHGLLPDDSHTKTHKAPRNRCDAYDAHLLSVSINQKHASWDDCKQSARWIRITDIFSYLMRRPVLRGGGLVLRCSQLSKGSLVELMRCGCVFIGYWILMEHTSSVYLRGYLNKTVSGVAFDGRGTSSCPGTFTPKNKLYIK